METDKIFFILENFENDQDEDNLLEELKKIYEEEIIWSFQGPEIKNKNNEEINKNSNFQLDVKKINNKNQVIF